MAFVVAGLLLLTELVHSVWLVRVPVWGQIPDPAIPLIIAISFRRPDSGPGGELGVGLLQDLLFGGTLGLFALSKLIVGHGAGVLGRTVLVDQPLLPWIVTALATVLQQVILVIVLAVTDLLPVSVGARGAPAGEVPCHLSPRPGGWRPSRSSSCCSSRSCSGACGRCRCCRGATTCSCPRRTGCAISASRRRGGFSTTARAGRSPATAPPSRSPFCRWNCATRSGCCRAWRRSWTCRWRKSSSAWSERAAAPLSRCDCGATPPSGSSPRWKRTA